MKKLLKSLFLAFLILFSSPVYSQTLDLTAISIAISEMFLGRVNILPNNRWGVLTEVANTAYIIRPNYIVIRSTVKEVWKEKSPNQFDSVSSTIAVAHFEYYILVTGTPQHEEYKFLAENLIDFNYIEVKV